MSVGRPILRPLSHGVPAAFSAISFLRSGVRAALRAYPRLAAREVLPSGDGIIYAPMPNNDLLWYRHDGRGDSSFGWGFPEGKRLASAGTLVSSFRVLRIRTDGEYQPEVLTDMCRQ